MKDYTYTLINVDLNERATHGSVAHADDIVSEAMLRIFYNVDPKGLHRIDTDDKNAVEKSKQMFCFDFGGGMYDHHSESDSKICYPNGVIMASCGKILAAAVNDYKISVLESEYLLEHGLYALQAQDNGQDWKGFYRPFQVITLLTTPFRVYCSNNYEISLSPTSTSTFDALVSLAETILTNLLFKAEILSNNRDEFLKSLNSISPEGIISSSKYIDGFEEMAISDNFKRISNDKINFHIFPSVKEGFIAETVKRDFGSFVDRISFDPEKDKVPGVKFINPSGSLCYAETEEACRQACCSAFSRAMS